MDSCLDKLKIAFGNCIHKKTKVITRDQEENLTEPCCSQKSSDGNGNGAIKRNASIKGVKHNIPSSLIELTTEEKQRLKYNVMMMHLQDYNML